MADDSNSDRWIAVCSIDRFHDARIVCATADGASLIIIQDGERFFATERACPHEQADLAQGDVKNGQLHCPRHQAWFDLTSGAISPGWTSRALRRYPVRIHAEKIWVNVT